MIWDTEKRKAPFRKAVSAPHLIPVTPSQSKARSAPFPDRVNQAALGFPSASHTLIPASHSSEMSFSRSSRSFFWAEATSTCVSVVLIFSSEA